MTPKQLLKKYPFIVVTHQTSDYLYKLELCKKAHEQGQPQTVTYCKCGIKWVTIKEYRNENYIQIFNQICKERGFDFEVNSKVLKYDLFFRNVIIETISDNNLRIETNKIIDAVLKRYPYGSRMFYQKFYDSFFLNFDLEVVNKIKSESLDWKY